MDVRPVPGEHWWLGSTTPPGTAVTLA
jgi:hypothetical protein